MINEEQEGDFWFDKIEALLYQLEDKDKDNLDDDQDKWDSLREHYSRYDDACKKFEAKYYKLHNVFAM